MRSVTQTIETVCPACGNKFTMEVYILADAADPGVEDLVVSGAINSARCPHCGYTGRLEVPFAYHDAGHELFLVYFPNNVSLSATDKNQFIGGITEALMKSLPPEKRKGYLLRPKEFLTLQGLAREILHAKGLSDEEIDRLAKQEILLNNLLNDAGDVDKVDELVKRSADLIDERFVLDLLYLVDELKKERQQENAEALDAMVNRVQEETEAGRKVSLFRKQIEKAMRAPSFEEVFDALVEIPESLWPEAAAISDPIVGEEFFTKLAQEIVRSERSDPEKADRLRKMKEVFMERRRTVEEAERKSYAGAQQMVQQLLDAEDVNRKVQELAPEILSHPSFPLALESARVLAEESGNQETLAKLEAIRKSIEKIIFGENPEVALILKLLSVPYPEGVQATLKANKDAITPKFFEALDQVISASQDEEERKLLQNLKAMAMLIS